MNFPKQLLSLSIIQTKTKNLIQFRDYCARTSIETLKTLISMRDLRREKPDGAKEPRA